LGGIEIIRFKDKRCVMFDKEVFWLLMFGGVAIEFLVAFYIFAGLGVFLSFLFHYGKKQLKDKKVNKAKTFSLGYWIKDYTVRLLTSIVVIFILVRFYKDFPISLELNMFLALCTGVSLDQVIVFIRNRTNINIFQAKS